MLRLAATVLMLILATAVPVGARAEAPQVVVSVKPLHSLVAGVMRGAGEPHLLVRGAASPHAFALRPSDARALSQAGLVIWVGPMLETFLEKPLQSLAGGAEMLAVSRLPDIHMLPTRSGGVWDVGGHDHAHAPTGGALATDGHLWLNPLNAKLVTEAVAAALIRLDPAHAGLYRDNAAAQVASLDRLDAEMAAALAPVRQTPFIVFHDAYHYLEERYGLRAAGAITVTPDQPPGAARLAALRQQINAAGAVCVFSEPQFEPSLVRTLVEGTPARTAVLDPEGANIPDGPDLYPTLMRFNLRSLVDCLSGG